jgi:hypothetical protein
MISTQIAGPVAVIELGAQDTLPRILAGTGRARQTEDVGAVSQSGTGTRLDGGGCHLLKRNHVEDDRKAVDFFLKQGLTASGVTSRPVNPVPPVVITTSMAG